VDFKPPALQGCHLQAGFVIYAETEANLEAALLNLQ
jgi:hypothetical protein